MSEVCAMATLPEQQLPNLDAVLCFLQQSCLVGGSLGLCWAGRGEVFADDDPEFLARCGSSRYARAEVLMPVGMRWYLCPWRRASICSRLEPGSVGSSSARTPCRRRSLKRRVCRRG